MKSSLLIASLALHSSLSFAGDEWRTQDTILQSLYTTALLLDCAQARNATNNYEKYYEANPLLNKEPSKGRINNTCLATGLGHFAISYALPHDWRTAWLLTSITVEVLVISNNRRIGLKFEF